VIKALQDSGVVIIGRLLFDVNFSDAHQPAELLDLQLLWWRMTEHYIALSAAMVAANLANYSDFPPD
jgi:hypothetical protein